MAFYVITRINIMPILLNWIIEIFTSLKLCLATATHSFKWLEITDICSILHHQTLPNFVIYTANKTD